nr:hypothetical protein [Staphylococcus pseudintermedius]
MLRQYGLDHRSAMKIAQSRKNTGGYQTRTRFIVHLQQNNSTSGD